MEVCEKGRWKSRWTVIKYKDEEEYRANNPCDIQSFEGNMLLSEGITELWKLAAGLTATPFSNANAYIGVGDSTTAASADQTGLVATTNKVYKPMDAGYPQVNGTTVAFRATFGASDANFDWNEFTVANGSSDSAVNLNRKVQVCGTKVSPTVWALILEITLS